MTIPGLDSGESAIENKNSSGVLSKMGSMPFKNKILALLMLSGLLNAEDVAGKTPRDEKVQAALQAFGKQLPTNTTLQGFLKDVQDGLSTEEETGLRKSMETVVAGSPQYRPFAQSVLNALNEQTTSNTDNTPAVTGLPAKKDIKVPLGETSEEKKVRETHEKIIADANKFFNDPKSATVTDDSTAAVDVKSSGTDRIFTVKKAGARKKPEKGQAPTATVSFSYGPKRIYHLQPGTSYIYSIEAPSSTKQPNENREDITGARLLFFNQQWQRLDLEGNVDNKFGEGIKVGEASTITIPKGCAYVEEKYSFSLEIDLSTGEAPTQKRYAVGKTTITKVGEVKVAGK